MDECTGRRASSELIVSRRRPGLVSRDITNNRGQNAQFCSRIGCSGRLNSTKGNQPIKLNSNSSKFSLHSSGKEVTGSSSRTCSVVNNRRKSCLEPSKNLTALSETDSSESSSVHDEPESSELEIQAGSQIELKGEVTEMEEGSSSLTSTTRSLKKTHKKSGLRCQNSIIGSSVCPTPTSQSISLGARSDGSSNASKYGLRNLRCNSISDIIPSGCSSIESRKGIGRKRNPEAESSTTSFRDKKPSGASSKEEGRIRSYSNGITISDSRGVRNRDTGGSSIRMQRFDNGSNRLRLHDRANRSSLSSIRSPGIVQQIPRSEDPSSSCQLSDGSSSSRPCSYSPPSGRSENLRGINSIENGIARALVIRDEFRRFNMDEDGIAELLLALERIDQDEEEVAYEQLLGLETNWILAGLNINDQHRDMRLDIDNMSYEELLALEEKMGIVSTALSEDTLSKCLKSSIFIPISATEAVGSMDSAISTGHDYDVKCSICQEEYVGGDELGSLVCEHRYHVVCIQQWLRLKNWCPICKASAAPSSSTRPSSSSSSSSYSSL